MLVIPPEPNYKVHDERVVSLLVCNNIYVNGSNKKWNLHLKMPFSGNAAQWERGRNVRNACVFQMSMYSIELYFAK